jgi:hypothetical protein
MKLATHEFIRRFLLHVLPRGFHRIHHYGLLAASSRQGQASSVLARCWPSHCHAMTIRARNRPTSFLPVHAAAGRWT